MAPSTHEKCYHKDVLVESVARHATPSPGLSAGVNFRVKRNACTSRDTINTRRPSFLASPIHEVLPRRMIIAHLPPLTSIMVPAMKLD
jgi:hypothetical protein